MSMKDYTSCLIVTHDKVYERGLIVVNSLKVIVSVHRLEPWIVVELRLGDSRLVLQTQHRVDVVLLMNCGKASPALL